MAQPWETEPDSKDWVSQGYHCAIRRGPKLRALLGYVAVDRDHPWHGLGCGDRVVAIGPEALPPKANFIDIRFEAARGEDDGKVPLSLAVAVHGGITYAGTFAGDHLDGDSRLWVFRFDCSHAEDLVPGLPLPCGTYRDMDYVTAEVERLAVMLHHVQLRGH